MRNLIHKFFQAFLYILLPLAWQESAGQQHKEVLTYENQKEMTATGSITFKPGFSIPAGTNFRAYISTNPGMNVGTKLKPSMNAVVSYTAKVPGLIELSDTTHGINQVDVEVQTLDHFGRLKETQSIKAAPNFRDIIQLTQYDLWGRENIKHLPYAYPTGNTNYAQLGYSVIADSYYGEFGERSGSIALNANPASTTIFDDSPLGRVYEVRSPGTGGSVRTRMAYSTGDNVLKYRMHDNFIFLDSVNFLYHTGLIKKTVITNENVGNDEDGTIHEYRDLDGNLIERRVLYRLPDGGLAAANTSYVYDGRGNLCFVLPPNASYSQPGPVNQTMLDNYAYQYHYDSANRLVRKKLPGKGWEFIVYNKSNQVVMTQDAVQRNKTPQEWNVIKYDALGRTVMTGIYQHLGVAGGLDSLNNIQGRVDRQSKEWESRTSTGNGYTGNTYPSGSVTTMSLNYYDDYNFPGGNPYPYAGAEVSKMTRGMLTGSKVNVLGTSNLLWTVNYYDEDGRAVKNFKQHYKGNALVAGNYDEISSSYDFTGKVTSTTRSHKVAGAEQLKVLNEYSYDHRGRKINSWETINAQPRVLVAQNEYDDMSNVYRKKLHSTDNGASFLQTIAYNYNDRGWLARAQAPKLDVKLRYFDPINGAKAQYNGNISEFEYTGERSGNRSFKYSYDAFDRLTKADYSGGTELNEELAYDLVGNITSLKRGAATATLYNYTTGGAGNQLRSVSGGLAGSFTYDVNGSMLMDGTRAATLTYNQLNLPATVTRSGGNASYLYDASGSKLRSAQGSDTREYISGIQYTNNALDFVATEEGRAVRNPSTGVYKYEYNLKDHLGNVRVTFDKFNDTARVIQEDEFYAFGLNAPKYLLGDKNRYLYNGKELQDVLSNEYDYGARFYDPVIGRWSVVDPLAEKFFGLNPYNYTDNSPINNIDPDGMETYYGAEAQAVFGYFQRREQFIYDNFGPGDPKKKAAKLGETYIMGLADAMKDTRDQFMNNFTVEGYLNTTANIFTFGALDSYNLIEGSVKVAQNAPNYTSEDYVYGAGVITAKAAEIYLTKRVGGKVSKALDFKLNNGFGVFGKKGLKIGNYKIHALHENGSVEGGTYFSVKQQKQGGNMLRFDKGSDHITKEMGYHSTFRFNFGGNTYGGSRQFPVSAPFQFWKYKQK